jgi:hypothetical protein
MNFEAIGKITVIFFFLYGMFKTIEFIYNRCK